MTPLISLHTGGSMSKQRQQKRGVTPKPFALTPEGDDIGLTVGQDGDDVVHHTFERYRKSIHNVLMLLHWKGSSEEIFEKEVKSCHVSIRGSRVSRCLWYEWCLKNGIEDVYGFIAHKKDVYARYDSGRARKNEWLKKFNRWFDTQDNTYKIETFFGSKISEIQVVTDEELCNALFQTQCDRDDFVDAQIIPFPERFKTQENIATICSLFFSALRDDREKCTKREKYYFPIHVHFFDQVEQQLSDLAQKHEQLECDISCCKRRLDKFRKNSAQDGQEDFSCKTEEEFLTVLEDSRCETERYHARLSTMITTLKDEHESFTRLAFTHGVEVEE